MSSSASLVTADLSAHVTRLERLITRLLFDPALVEELFESPQRLLAEGELTSEELAWLTAVDRRRWRADEARAHRALEGLLLHLPLSVALSVEGGVSAGELLGFFSSPEFHHAIKRRGLMSEAFGEWLLKTHPSPYPTLLNSTLTLERSAARLKAREAQRAPLELPLSLERALRLSPLVALLEVSEGWRSLYVSLKERLAERAQREGALAPLSQGALGPLSARLSDLEGALEEASSGAPVMLLLERVGSEVRLSEPPSALSALLKLAQEPVETARLLLVMEQRYELSRAEALEVLEDLVSDGLLW